MYKLEVARSEQATTLVERGRKGGNQPNKKSMIKKRKEM
jgi:hypothetical protein